MKVENMTYNAKTAFTERMEIIDKLNECINFINTYTAPGKIADLESKNVQQDSDIANLNEKISNIETKNVNQDEDIANLKSKNVQQAYIATIPQTNYLDVCLAQYVRIGRDKGLLSFSGHMRDISLPNDVWTLISVDTIMSAMGLTYRRPPAYRNTGWWHYDDGDDHSDKYGFGTVCQVSPSGGLELGRFYSGTDIGSWELSSIGQNRYISVRDVYVEIQSDAQHTLSAPSVVPCSQHTFRVMNVPPAENEDNMNE